MSYIFKIGLKNNLNKVDGQFCYNGGILCAILTKTIKVASKTDIDFRNLG